MQNSNFARCFLRVWHLVAHWRRNVGWGFFENWVMSKLFGLYLPSIFRVMKSRRIRWVGHVARMVDMRCAYKILVGRPEGKWPLGRPRRRREKILKYILKKQGQEAWSGLMWVRLGTGGGHLLMRWWIYEFHGIEWISWVAENLLASQEGSKLVN